MSDLFCFGCNYDGETHDERCEHFVDVDRLTAERDQLKARVAELEAEAIKVERFKWELFEDARRLRAALERYGAHTRKCGAKQAYLSEGGGCMVAFPVDCDCGLETALGKES